MTLKCIIVDDSEIQRAIVNKLIIKHPALKLVGNFSNAVETKNFLSFNTVDLIFLDIEMPVLNGFEFLDILKIKPQVIFITSRPEYAVKAFDYEATDYLQKPINPARFDTAVKKALSKQLQTREKPVLDSEHIFIKSKMKNQKIYTSTIQYLEAYGDYVKLIADDEKHLVLSTMKFFENELPEKKFFRAHKSFIVNLNKVDKFTSKDIEIGNVKIPLSRTKKDELKKAFANI